MISEQQSIIRFNDVLTNIGHGYDVDTGIFVASVVGLYSFTIDVASPVAARAYIMFNGKYVGYCFLIGGKWEPCSQTVALQLNIGDKVWATGIGQIEGYEEYKCKNRGEQCYHSTFTGFKVQSL